MSQLKVGRLFDSIRSRGRQRWLLKEIFANLSNRERKYLNLAVNMAGASEMKQQHGAVVVKGGRVLALGINKLKNHPEIISEYNKCSVHAEADALSRVKNPAGCTVYVARINNSGDTMFSRPCDNCHRLMVSLGVSKVVYTD